MKPKMVLLLPAILGLLWDTLGLSRPSLARSITWALKSPAFWA